MPKKSLLPNFELLFDHTQIGMGLRDNSGTWLRVNTAFSDILGIDKRNLNQFSIEQFIKESKCDPSTEFEILQKGEKQLIQFEALLKGVTEEFWGKVTVCRIGEVGSIDTVYFYEVEDINRTKFLESEQARRIESRLNNAKLVSIGNLAGDIAHEINNPLTILNGNLSLLEKELSNEDFDRTKVSRFLSSIKSSSERVSKVSHELLYLTESAKKDAYEDTNLTTILDNVFFLCKNRLIKDGIEVMIQEELELNTIKCHRANIVQALLNIIHYMRENLQKVEEKWLDISFEDNEAALTLVFSGPYMESCRSVFNNLSCPYYRPNCDDETSGVELTLTKSVIEEHHGTIENRNYDDISSIAITLPKSLKSLIKKSA